MTRNWSKSIAEIFLFCLVKTTLRTMSGKWGFPRGGVICTTHMPLPPAPTSNPVAEFNSSPWAHPHGLRSCRSRGLLARTSHTCQGHATPKANISPYGNYSPVCCQVFKEKPDANCSPLDLAAARSLGCQRMQHTRPLPSSHPLSLHRCSGKQDKQPNYWVVEAALGRWGPLSLSSEKV